MCGGIAEGDLEDLVEILKGGICGTGQCAPDRWVGNGVGTEVEFENVIRSFAVDFVSGPVLGLAFCAWRTSVKYRTTRNLNEPTAVCLVLAACTMSEL